MKKRNLAFILTGSMLLCTVPFSGAGAAFEPSMETAYNTAVQGQDTLDGFDVLLTENTVSSKTNLSSSKKATIKVTGVTGNKLTAALSVTTDEGTSSSYYSNGYYYTTASSGAEKVEMDRADIWDMINSEIYLDMTSNYLRMLYAMDNSDGSRTFHFAATADSLGDYARKLLFGTGGGQDVTIDTLTGTMEVDGDGNITSRNMEMVYTVGQGEGQETFFVQTTADFRQTGQNVDVRIPDLGEYKEQKSEEPAATITPLNRTVYATADVNVRAAGSLSAALLGGLSTGSGITQTGYTSDGWIQVQYNGSTGYIWGDYISTSKPVLTKNSSGIMYATAAVNIRQSHTSDSQILGTLDKGSSIEITGTTDNGWTRVKYNGQTAYIYSDYLSWSEPIADNYIRNGVLTGIVTDASYGTLVIERDDGQGTAVFNTMYASMDVTDSIYTGDRVEVSFSGSGTPYTASRVSDYTAHSTSSEKRSVNVSGVVDSCTRSSLVIFGSDGIRRTFNITDTDIEMMDYPTTGQYVVVYWMSSTDGAETKNIDALRITG